MVKDHSIPRSGCLEKLNAYGELININMMYLQRKMNRQSAQFSLNPAIIQDILTYAKPLGHNEKPANMNLGFGFLYYGLVRSLRPKHILVIGSGFGFSVTCLALGLKDNNEGQLSFVDPSYSLTKDGPFKTIGGQNTWSSPEMVHARFARFGVDGVVRHFKMTSQEFFASYSTRRLPKVQLGFIDGSHAFADVREDFLGMYRHCVKNSYILMHDTNIYIREMLNHSGVKRWLNIVRDRKDTFEAVDFPFDSGVALIRVRRHTPWDPES